MKKIISLLLVLWLPLFFSTAGYAATSMQAQAGAVSSKADVQTHHAQMSEHCKMMFEDNASQPDKDQNQRHTGKNACQHCGFCVSLGFFAVPDFGLQQSHHPLISHTGWASSPHTTSTDLRPPITAA